MTKVFPYSGNEQACPYWSGMNNYCLLNDDGLYLPFAEHVNTYCLTINYRVCPHLLDQCVLENLPSGNVAKGNKTSQY